jgi:hypothetical protein
MVKLKNIHPGEILSEEFLIPFNISAYFPAQVFRFDLRRRLCLRPAAYNTLQPEFFFYLFQKYFSKNNKHYNSKSRIFLQALLRRNYAKASRQVWFFRAESKNLEKQKRTIKKMMHSAIQIAIISHQPAFQ